MVRGKEPVVRDMYADLEKIEARGKRKKDKSKGLFSSFGKKDEPEPEDAAPQPLPEVPKREDPIPEPVEETKPIEQPATKAEPAAPAEPEPVEDAPVPTVTVKNEPVQEVKRPAPATPPPQHGPPGWEPLSGSKLKKAEDDLLTYKRWLNSGFKSGVLSKQECLDMTRKKEVELGLKPPQ